MPEATYNINRDLEEAKALADHLIPYVYEDQLYGSIAGMFGSSSMPALTIGALLQRLQRLHALENSLTADQKAKLSAIDAQNESARKEWTIHYNEKLAQEGISRLKMIERYFGDCDDDPRTCANNYIPEANRRTIVEAIANTLARNGTPNAELTKALGRVDSKLRRYAQPSDFVWAADLQAAYPKDEYWWLYARPPRAGAK
ncbi:MAG: hypothetical protein GC204_00765 [Chloroflexi bacterium]|nr:hypothetical protein [Chloroflexota bacterium]